MFNSVAKRCIFTLTWRIAMNQLGVKSHFGNWYFKIKRKIVVRPWCPKSRHRVLLNIAFVACNWLKRKRRILDAEPFASKACAPCVNDEVLAILVCRFRHAAVRSMLGGRVKPSQLRPKVLDVAEVVRISRPPTRTGISFAETFSDCAGLTWPTLFSWRVEKQPMRSLQKTLLVA